MLRGPELIVVASLQDGDVLLIGDVDETVGFIDPSGPGAGEGVLEGFGFADPVEGVVSEAVGDEQVDPSERFAILTLPVQVVFPPLDGPCELPVTQEWCSSCSVTSPARARSIALSSRRAFSGERRR